jgi:hypothetical protein
MDTAGPAGADSGQGPQPLQAVAGRCGSGMSWASSRSASQGLRLSSCTIGGGTGGSPPACGGSWGHRNGTARKDAYAEPVLAGACPIVGSYGARDRFTRGANMSAAYYHWSAPGSCRWRGADLAVASA